MSLIATAIAALIASLVAGTVGTATKYGSSSALAQQSLNSDLQKMLAQFGYDKALNEQKFGFDLALQQDKMSNEYQRQVADLKAAGLNPALRLGSGTTSFSDSKGFTSGVAPSSASSTDSLIEKIENLRLSNPKLYNSLMKYLKNFDISSQP